MELIKSFGFDPYLFVAQIVNFLIVLYVLKRFLYKPVMMTIQKRRDEIKAGLQSAEEGKKLLLEADEKEKKLLKNAQDEARKLVSDAKKEAIEMTTDMEENARKRTEKMLLDAKSTIDEEVASAQKRLSGSVSQLAVQMLESSLKNFFSVTEQKEVMEKAMKQMKKQSD